MKALNLGSEDSTLIKVCSYNGLGNRRVSAGNKVSPARVCATVVPSYRVTVMHLSTSVLLRVIFVVISGELETVRPSGAHETLIARVPPGQFTGEVNTLSGRGALNRIR